MKKLDFFKVLAVAVVIVSGTWSQTQTTDMAEIKEKIKQYLEDNFTAEQLEELRSFDSSRLDSLIFNSQKFELTAEHIQLIENLTAEQLMEIWKAPVFNIAEKLKEFGLTGLTLEQLMDNLTVEQWEKLDSISIERFDLISIAEETALAEKAKQLEEQIERLAEKAKQNKPQIEQILGRYFVKVRGGKFKMGCTVEQGEDCYDNEKPVRNVKLSNFSIGKYEVTQKLWKLVMGSNPSNFKRDDLPVEGVSWDDVQIFISVLNAVTGKKYRLPTEAEWEFAARGGNKSKGYKYSGSNNLDEVGWYNDKSSVKKTNPVGQKKPNELGIYDMSGNVYEWCGDLYGRYDERYNVYDYRLEYTNYDNHYSANVVKVKNPTGPSNDWEYASAPRVLRGGFSGDDAPQLFRISYREGFEPSDNGGRTIWCGFRLAVPIKRTEREQAERELAARRKEAERQKEAERELAAYYKEAEQQKEIAQQKKTTQQQVTGVSGGGNMDSGFGGGSNMNHKKKTNFKDDLSAAEGLTSGRSRGDIMRVVRQKMASLQYAYHQRLKDKPRIQGRITVRWSIDEFGNVISCKLVGTTINDDTFEQTVVNIIKMWEFGKINISGDVTEVEYPFVFVPD